MDTTATTAPAGLRPSPLPPAAGRAGLRGVLASELTKLRSVRSTYWTITALVIISVGIAAIVGLGIAASIRSDPSNQSGTDGTQSVLIAFFEFGQLIVAVIGAMTITSEYSTGMIRTSLTAMPRRGTVYLGKLLALSAVMLVVSLVTSFAAFFVGSAALSGSGVAGSLFHSVTEPSGVVTPGHVLTAVIGSALFVTLMALIAFGLGAIIRHTAGAVTSAIGLMFVLSIVIQVLPGTWRDDLVRFLPDAAGPIISATLPQSQDAHLWSGWPQLLVTVAWAAALVGLGAYFFRRRDA